MSTSSAYTAPEVARSALLTIDMQKDFTEPGGESPIAGTKSCVPAMVRILEAYRKCRLPVIHVIRLYQPDGTNADLCRRALLAAGKKIVAPNSSGAELVNDFTVGLDLRLEAASLLAGRMQAIRDREWLMYKPRWDAFYGTSLESHLRGLSVTSVVIVGCNFPNCPRATAYGASMRDFRVALLRDAVSGVYEQGLQELRNIAIETPSVEEWARRLEPVSAEL